MKAEEINPQRINQLGESLFEFFKEKRVMTLEVIMVCLITAAQLSAENDVTAVESVIALKELIDSFKKDMKEEENENS